LLRLLPSGAHAEIELPEGFDFGKLRAWKKKIPSQRLRTIVENKTVELENTH